FVVGLDLAGDLGDARLSHELGVRRIEAMYLCGRFEEAERLAEALLECTELPLDKAAVLEQLVLAHTTQLQYRKALDTAAPQLQYRRPAAPAVRALELLGEHIPGRPSTAQVMAELVRTKLALAGRSVDSLRALPRMVDQHKLMAMRILMLATAPAYFEDQNLLPLVALRMVRLSVRYGNAG